VPQYNPQQQYMPGQYGGPPQQYHPQQTAGMPSQGFPQPPMSMPQQQPNYMNAAVNQMGVYPGYQQQQTMPDQYAGYPQAPPPQQMRMMGPGPGQPGVMQMPGGGPQMMGASVPGQIAGMPPMQPGGGQHPGSGMMPSAAGGQVGQMRPSQSAAMTNTMSPPSGQMQPGQYTNYPQQQGQF